MAPPVQGWDRVQPGVARPAAEEIGGGGLAQVDLGGREGSEINSGPRRGTRLRQAPDKLTYSELGGSKKVLE